MIKKKNDAFVGLVEPNNQDELLWKQFVQMVSAHIDPVLASMLYATDLVLFDRSKQMVEVVTLKKFILFQDLFLEQKHVYQKYLDQLFGFQAMLLVKFTKVEEPMTMQSRIAKSSSQLPAVATVVAQPKQNIAAAVSYHGKKTSLSLSKSMAKGERAVDVSDVQKWKITHTLLSLFGGTVREIIRDIDEFDA